MKLILITIEVFEMHIENKIDEILLMNANEKNKVCVFSVMLL